MKTIFFINLLLLSIFFKSVSQPILGDLPKSVFLDMQLVEKPKKRALLIEHLQAELVKYHYSVPDITFTVKEKKLSCFKNTYYYEFEAITNDTCCLYLMAAQDKNYFLLQSFYDEDKNEQSIKKLGKPILETEKQILEYVCLFANLVNTEPERDRISSRFRLVYENTDKISPLKTVKTLKIEPLKYLGFKENKHRVSGFLAFDGGIYEAGFTISPEGKVNLPHALLLGHCDYRDRFENGKIAIYSELDYFKPTAKKIEDAYQKEISFSNFNYETYELDLYELTDEINFSLVDLSKLDWQRNNDTLNTLEYKADITFELTDSLEKGKLFIFMGVNLRNWDIISDTNKSIEPLSIHFIVDQHEYTFIKKDIDDNLIKKGEYSVRLYSHDIQEEEPKYMAFSVFSASKSDEDKLFRTLLELQKQTDAKYFGCLPYLKN